MENSVNNGLKMNIWNKTAEKYATAITSGLLLYVSPTGCLLLKPCLKGFELRTNYQINSDTIIECTVSCHQLAGPRL